MIPAGCIDIAGSITYILQNILTRMSGGQSYIVRVLRSVESMLGKRQHLAEATKVGKILQKLANADDIHTALEDLHRVEGLDEFALRLMWLLDVVERGELLVGNDVLSHHASLLEETLTRTIQPGKEKEPAAKSPVPDQLDQLYVTLHKFGLVIEEMKRHSIAAGAFRGIEEGRMFHLLSVLASLEEQAAGAGMKTLHRFAVACSGFVHFVLDNGRLHDIRVVNILNSTNLTVQTGSENAGVENNDALQSLLQLLDQPKDLLD